MKLSATVKGAVADAKAKSRKKKPFWLPVSLLDFGSREWRCSNFQGRTRPLH
jgi:hypothetical protein